MFHVGQEVICVHVEKVNNPRHNVNPVVKGRVYIVLVVNPEHAYIAVQRPNLMWPSTWFRPLAKGKETSIEFALKLLRQPISVIG